MKQTQRATAWVLALFAVAGCLVPALTLPAFAQPDGIPIASVSALSSALQAMQSEDNLTFIIQNETPLIFGSEPLVIPKNRTVTLCAAYPDRPAILRGTDYTGTMFTVARSSNLNLADIRIDGGNLPGINGVIISNNGNLGLLSGAVVSGNRYSGPDSAAIHHAGTSLSILAGAQIGDAENGIYLAQEATLTLAEPLSEAGAVSIIGVANADAGRVLANFLGGNSGAVRYLPTDYSLVCEEGTYRLAAPVAAPLTLVSTVPTSNAEAVNSPISITFDRAISAAGSLENIVLSPSVDGLAPAIEGAVLHLYHGGLAPGQTYRVTVPGGTIEGYSEAIAWSFATAPAEQPQPPEDPLDLLRAALAEGGPATVIIDNREGPVAVSGAPLSVGREVVLTALNPGASALVHAAGYEGSLLSLTDAGALTLRDIALPSGGAAIDIQGGLTLSGSVSVAGLRLYTGGSIAAAPDFSAVSRVAVAWIENPSEGYVVAEGVPAMAAAAITYESADYELLYSSATSRLVLFTRTAPPVTTLGALRQALSGGDGSVSVVIGNTDAPILVTDEAILAADGALLTASAPALPALAAGEGYTGPLLRVPQTSGFTLRDMTLSGEGVLIDLLGTIALTGNIAVGAGDTGGLYLGAAGEIVCDGLLASSRIGIAGAVLPPEGRIVCRGLTADEAACFSYLPNDGYALQYHAADQTLRLEPIGTVRTFAEAQALVEALPEGGSATLVVAQTLAVLEDRTLLPANKSVTLTRHANLAGPLMQVADGAVLTLGTVTIDGTGSTAPALRCAGRLVLRGGARIGSAESGGLELVASGRLDISDLGTGARIYVDRIENAQGGALFASGVTQGQANCLTYRGTDGRSLVSFGENVYIADRVFTILKPYNRLDPADVTLPVGQPKEGEVLAGLRVGDAAVALDKCTPVESGYTVQYDAFSALKAGSCLVRLDFDTPQGRRVAMGILTVVAVQPKPDDTGGGKDPNPDNSGGFTGGYVPGPGSGSGGSGKTQKKAEKKAVQAPAVSPPATLTLSVADAAYQKAVAAAAGQTITLRFSGVGEAPAAVALALSNKAAASGYTAQALFDTPDSAGAVGVRLYVSLPITEGFTASGRAEGPAVEAVRTLFGRWYQNRLAVLQLDHMGGFGRRIPVAARIDLAGWDVSRLAVYTYDKTANRFAPANGAQASYREGYLYLTVEQGGFILISDGPLAKRAG